MRHAGFLRQPAQGEAGGEGAAAQVLRCQSQVTPEAGCCATSWGRQHPGHCCSCARQSAGCNQTQSARQPLGLTPARMAVQQHNVVRPRNALTATSLEDLYHHCAFTQCHLTGDLRCLLIISFLNRVKPIIHICSGNFEHPFSHHAQQQNHLGASEPQATLTMLACVSENDASTNQENPIVSDICKRKLARAEHLNRVLYSGCL